ncbi:SNF2-related protein [Microbacterium sp.]|uniref:SNF2-related protein n=1 Tax=Microbacterium sp. TaxID=51671 RepID=UPI003A857C2C
MLVLHAAWVRGDGARVWAEDSEPSVTSTSQAVQRARRHPFAVSGDGLRSMVDGDEVDTEVLLPSTRRSPLDSRQLVRGVPRRPGRSPASLLPWTVAAIRPAALALHDGVFEVDPNADVRPGATAHYLVELGRFADDLVARGRILPAIRQTADGVEARWRVALTGPDAVTAHAVTADMPPAFRAADPEAPPVALVTDVLETIADARIRQRMPQTLLPRRRGRAPARPPVVDGWLAALTAHDAGFDADPDEVTALREQLAPWNEATEEAAGPARLVLRLTDPGPDAAHGAPGAPSETDAPPATAHVTPPLWRLDFLLRSRDDPSLLVEAATAWSDDGALSRWLERPREVLLTELARAVRVYGALEPGLRQRHPTGLDLDASDAFALLSAGAPTLDQAGFEVLLPSWWGRRAKLGLKASATPSDGGAADAGFGRDALCDFRWELAVGGHGLSAQEIEALVAAKAPLVRLRGQWVAVDQVQLQRGLEFLRHETGGSKTAGEVLTLALSHPDDLDLPLELIDVDAGGWLGELLGAAADDTAAEADPPDGFGATLRPYQRRGLGWLDFLGRLGLGACLADDMGLGKTVQLLALEATRRMPQAPASAPTLLLCPVSLIANWQAEAARFTPGLRVLAYHGPSRPRGEAWEQALARTDLVVTTYATALGDIEQLAEVEWARIVLDEAQAIKNRLSRTAVAVRKLRGGQRIALTGTPVENRLAELWSIMDFVNPGVLGSATVFRERFATPIERHHDAEATGVLRRITRPYILRRLKTDPAIIDDLPEKIEIDQHYRLTVEQASLYQSVVDDMMDKIAGSEGIERRGNVLAAMTKLKQVCNHPAQLLHDRSPIGRRSGKVIRLEEILEEVLAEGDRVLCFTQYTEFAEMLVPHLAARFDTDVAYLSGSTTRQQRAQMVERFQSGDGPPVFLLSLKAGGTGLNLTAANHVIHVDRWWNPAVENQATDRAFRIGQKRTVQVRKFIGTGTLEERIDELIRGKKALADMVVGDGESWLTELDTEHLRELFSLSKEAVGE